MARSRSKDPSPSAPVISIIGPGMVVVGDCATESSLRIEGRVMGSVYAGKAVVVGKDGVVNGRLSTHDAVVAGEVDGDLLAASRLEVHATARIRGQVLAGSIHLEEGAVLNGTVEMGEVQLGALPQLAPPSTSVATQDQGPAQDRAQDAVQDSGGDPAEDAEDQPRGLADPPRARATVGSGSAAG